MFGAIVKSILRGDYESSGVRKASGLVRVATLVAALVVVPCSIQRAEPYSQCFKNTIGGVLDAYPAIAVD